MNVKTLLYRLWATSKNVILKINNIIVWFCYWREISYFWWEVKGFVLILGSALEICVLAVNMDKHWYVGFRWVYDEQKMPTKDLHTF